MGSESFGGDLDSGGLDQNGESQPQLSEKAQEAVREQFKASQKAIKKIKAEERKAKVFDDGLGDIIEKFLIEGDRDFLISLIINLIEKNIPSDFILAIILPISDIADEKISAKLKDGGVGDLGLSIQTDSEFKQKIFNWINMIYSVAILEKEMILDSIIDHNSWKPIPSLDKLFLEVLRILLEKEDENQIIGEFEKNISQHVFVKIIEKLESEID